MVSGLVWRCKLEKFRSGELPATRVWKGLQMSKETENVSEPKSNTHKNAASHSS